MHQIRLSVNVLLEWALISWPWLLGAGVIWVLLMLWAMFRGQRAWGMTLGGAAGLALLVAVIAFFAIPTLVKSSLGDMSYWVDWAALMGLALGSGAAAFAFLWPLLAGMQRHKN